MKNKILLTLGGLAWIVCGAFNYGHSSWHWQTKFPDLYTDYYDKTHYVKNNPAGQCRGDIPGNAYEAFLGPIGTVALGIFDWMDGDPATFATTFTCPDPALIPKEPIH